MELKELYKELELIHLKLGAYEIEQYLKNDISIHDFTTVVNQSKRKNENAGTNWKAWLIDMFGKDKYDYYIKLQLLKPIKLIGGKNEKN